jgi:hypothetical protein
MKKTNHHLWYNTTIVIIFLAALPVILWGQGNLPAAPLYEPPERGTASEPRYADIPVIPDSANQHMYVMIPENLLHADLQILDSNGRLWAKTKADKTLFNIDVGSWPTGSYVVVLFNHLRLCHGNFTKL